MNSIEILANGKALPKNKIESTELEKKFNLSKNWIYDRTGINTRYYIEKEDLETLAIEASRDALKDIKIDIQDIGIIVFATTSTKKLMPGISYKIQKNLDIKKCICLDVLGPILTVV